MEFLSSAGIFGFIIPFLVVLTIVVFFHELGHFLVARWCGVTVETFSIGFGKEIIGRTDKHGTRWKISLLPLGGYVKFLGDYGAASVPDREHIDAIVEEAEHDGRDASGVLHLKPVWQRSAIVAAGPIANFILGIVVYAGLFMGLGDYGLDPVVGTVEEGSAAEEAGFLPDDLILAIDGRKVERFRDLQVLISMSAESEREIMVARDGQEVVLTATPRRVESEDAFGNRQKIGRLGITPRQSEEDIHLYRYGPGEALWEGTKRTGFIIERTFAYLGRLIRGKEDAKQLGGPVKIAQVSGQAAQLGVYSLIGLIAILSISIGLVNLFPIPLLDGGHLLYFGFEALRGKPLSERTQEFGFRIGLIVVLVTLIFVTWNDLNSIKAIEKLTGLFS